MLALFFRPYFRLTGRTAIYYGPKLPHTPFFMTLVAVIDVETTGLNPYRHHRIIEIAALSVSLDGTVVREFVTLINPDRDIGPTRIHGITSGEVLAAPRFEEIAGGLLHALEGCVAIAGHNVRFDHSFLGAEFGRLGYSFPAGPLLCTMHLAGGGSLSGACSDYGVAFEGEAHSARVDAFATSQLLVSLLNDAPNLSAEILNWSPIDWPDVPRMAARLLPRRDSRQHQATKPTYIQALLNRVLPDLPPAEALSATLSYTALLDRILQDRCVDEEEANALIELAARWKLSPKQIQTINQDYLLRLGEAALADGVVTDAERRDLRQVASLLGLDSQDLDHTLAIARQRVNEERYRASQAASPLRRDDFAGERVCFTGECECRLNGEAITRRMAAELATRLGLIVDESVTKKLDMLVVADPYTQSGKARKARRYGIRILHERVFWRLLGLEIE